MRNEAFLILVDAGIVTSTETILSALKYRETVRIEGPWEGGDYSGDDITESNWRALSRDYPDLLIDHSRPWDHGIYWLEIDPAEFGKGANREAAVDLAKTLARLVHDYPLYDEEDNAWLVEERAEEAWDAWLRSDLERELYDITGAIFDLEDHQELVWEVMSDHCICPEAEGHRDVHFPGLFDPEVIEDLAVRAIRAGALNLETVYDLTDLGYELIGAWMAEDYQKIHPCQLTLFDIEVVA